MYRTVLASSLLSLSLLGCSGPNSSSLPDDVTSNKGGLLEKKAESSNTATNQHDSEVWDDMTPPEDDAVETSARVPLIRGLQQHLDSSPVFRKGSEGLRESLSEADRLLYEAKQENVDAIREAGRQVIVTPDRPNILLIVADDLGYGDLGCYGQQLIKTPRLDKMAADGVRFTNFYAGSPQGDASWWCLLTGRYTAHSGQSGRSSYSISPQSVTLAEVMWQGAYDTAFFGNWCLASAERSAMPHLHGFDRWTGTLFEETSVNYYPEYIFSDGNRARITANSNDKKGVYSNDFFNQEVLSYLKHRQSRKPFFLVVAYSFPNDRRIASPLDAYKDRDWSDDQMAYASAIGRLDTHVGMILDRLQNLNLARRTAVFLTSDNASPQHANDVTGLFRSNGGLKGYKGSLYEGGIRVPLLARWPGRFPVAAVTHYPAAVWDLLPTFAELGGVVRRPSDIDGVSLAPVLRGKTGKPRGRLYWESHKNGLAQAVRTQQWKAIRPAGKMSLEDIELYDLDKDARETTNVAKERPEIVAEVIDKTSS